MTKDEALKLEMVDDEGENQAVRMFLALYGGACGVTTEQMRKHLKMVGFDGAWPEWANSHNGHLTKAGAQLWIRHLFAMAQPQQEPVAVALHTGTKQGIKWYREIEHGTPLYTSPPARKPLTDEEILDMAEWYGDFAWQEASAVGFCRAIEAKHGITGEQHG